MSTNIQDIILSNLLTNEGYMRRVIPFIQMEYFEGVNKDIFKCYVKYVAKYNSLPEVVTLSIAIEDMEMSDEKSSGILNAIPSFFEPQKVDESWLVDNTEKWCQDRALFNAVMESINIIDGRHATLGKNALPDILSKALSVSFDLNVGHDYLENIEERYDFYHKTEERLPFDLDIFNRITKNGLPKKSLSVVLAGTGVGKSLFMCHCAASSLSMGRNVLYITMEMAEERIAERIDANLLDLPIDQIETLTKDNFKKRVTKIREKTNGKLIIKEYPTSQAHAGHFRALLNELKLKKKFVPDIIFIDYLNICSSSRIKSLGGSVNSYTYIKSIAEELRGLAVEFNVPIMSATQTTRSGFSNSDPGLEDTSESFGLPATTDFMFALVSNDELDESNQILVKQLKNRYNDPNLHKRFVIGVDRAKMKLYDVDESEQDNLVKDTTTKEDIPLFDNTKFGKRMSEGFATIKA